MQLSILLLLLSLLFFFCAYQSSATYFTSSTTDRFIQCLSNRFNPSFAINQLLYTPNNSSFPSVLQSHIRNLRFNESTTPKPILIITPTQPSHIQAVVVCAKANQLLLKTRSGGHDYEGLSYVSNTNQPFIVVDMFNLNSVNVSIKEETTWVEAGATLGELYYSIAEKSDTHAFPAGVCPTVGISGHFSGGGYGNLIRKYGLSVDNIVDAQLIDVNGNLLDRKSMGEDLFWAITGGGGVSFGVVLAYKINLVRVPSVVTVFDINRTEDQNLSTIAQRWIQVADKLDNDLYVRMTFNITIDDTTGEKTIHGIFPTMYLGNSTALVALLNKDFPELGLQKSDCIEMSWIESVLFYARFPTGTPTNALLSHTPQRLNPYKIKSDYVKAPISKQGFEFIFEKMKELFVGDQMLTFNPYGGRMNEISEFAKPFPHRSGNIAKIQYEVNWKELGVEAANRYLNLTREMYDYMTPFVSKNPREAFLNYRDLDIGVNSHGKNAYVEGTIYGHKYFRETNYKRLAKVKSRVDPDNFLRNDQSIPPLSS